MIENREIHEFVLQTGGCSLGIHQFIIVLVNLVKNRWICVAQVTETLAKCDKATMWTSALLLTEHYLAPLRTESNPQLLGSDDSMHHRHHHTIRRGYSLLVPGDTMLTKQAHQRPNSSLLRDSWTNRSDSYTKQLELLVLPHQVGDRCQREHDCRQSTFYCLKATHSITLTHRIYPRSPPSPPSALR